MAICSVGKAPSGYQNFVIFLKDGTQRTYLHFMLGKNNLLQSFAPYLFQCPLVLPTLNTIPDYSVHNRTSRGYKPVTLMSKINAM